MQEFTHITRAKQTKREATQRVQDFKEIYELLDRQVASEQASRCIGCGNPFCHNACPLNNYIPYWLRANASKNLELAFKISNETNPFPEITGRVCPQERLCEGACTLNDGYKAVMIGSIETFITEEGFKQGLDIKFNANKTGKKVAVIGSGPAGLSVANYLLKEGIDVSMYEASTRAGGLLTYGIPGFKLDKSVVSKRVEILVQNGLKLYTSCEVGKDISFDEIANNHDAVFVAIGARKPRSAGVMNESANGCFNALDFLTIVQKEIFDKSKKELNLKDKRVVVVGGGDTAMDCLRSAIRLGAKEVSCIYRRSQQEMGGSKKEFKNAIEEGVNFIFNAAPKEIITNENEEVIAISTLKTTTNEGKVQTIKNSEFNISCDIVIFALGFSVEVPNFLVENGVMLNAKGEIIVDENYESKACGIYAGGDCVRGSDLVVRAANDGKKAAQAILKALK